MRINHIAIATKDRQRLVDLFSKVLGMPASTRLAQPDHGVYTTFIPDLQDPIVTTTTKIELLEELGDNSPIRNFLERNHDGGVHHVCIGVKSVQEIADKALAECQVRSLGGIKRGAHGKPVLFLHPKDTGGVLIELEED